MRTPRDIDPLSPAATDSGAAGGISAAVVLAAGAARRFGAPKLLMPFGDSTVLGSVVHALSLAGAAPIVVVAGANAEAVMQLLGDARVQVVCNPDPDGGMVSSIRIGVEALPESIQRFLIALGDQPRIRAEGISHVMGQHMRSEKGIAIPVHAGKRGHPIIFSPNYRLEILALTERQTLRDVIDAHRDDILEVDCESDAYLCDIDTREEYEHELRRWHSEQPYAALKHRAPVVAVRTDEV